MRLPGFMRREGCASFNIRSQREGSSQLMREAYTFMGCADRVRRASNNERSMMKCRVSQQAHGCFCYRWWGSVGYMVGVERVGGVGEGKKEDRIDRSTGHGRSGSGTRLLATSSPFFLVIAICHRLTLS